MKEPVEVIPWREWDESSDNACCADCGEDGGVSLKTCKSCMTVKYCNAECQRNHWATHKKECKIQAAKIRDEALFKDPPPKEDCPICFLPMPNQLISCVSLPPATVSSVPIDDFANANQRLIYMAMDNYYIFVAESAFVKDASIPFVSLETMISVLFAIPTELAKHLKITLLNY